MPTSPHRAKLTRPNQNRRHKTDLEIHRAPVLHLTSTGKEEVLLVHILLVQAIGGDVERLFARDANIISDITPQPSRDLFHN